jgi:sugar phosphate isomerase/epimerase
MPLNNDQADHMSPSRRSFLKISGCLAAGVVLSGTPLLGVSNSFKLKTMPFGFQLYTLRDIIADNPGEVIRQVAGFGYRQIESYEGAMGMYWGMGNTGFKELMDELGLTMISSHANVFDDFERKADEAAEIGVRYLVCPSIQGRIGPRGNLDDYRKMADTFNELGLVAKNAGITFAYHNHAYSFHEIDGEVPQKVLMDNTDPDLVEYQMDIYWVVAGGHDPEEWLRAYPNRFTTSHVKDLINGDDMESTVLGTGTIDFPRVLKLAMENGMKYFIVEQEAYTGTTPMDAVRKNADYMKNLRI